MIAVGTAARCIAVLGAALGVYAGACNAAEADAQNPAPIRAFEVEAGRRFDRAPGGKDESNLRVTYRGELVRSTGTPFKSASGLDLATPKLPAEAAGDRSRVALTYENRAARFGGALLEAEGVQPVPIAIAGLDNLDLRGAGAMATNDRGTFVAVGVESPPMRLPGLTRTEVTNWLVFGLNAQRNPAAAGGTPTDTRFVTYRTFVGKAFGWRKSADVGATAARIERQLLDQAKTLDEAKLLAKKIRASAKTGTPTNLQTLVLDAVDSAGSDSDWLRAVKSVAKQEADVTTDQPTLATYVEISGGRAVGGQDEGRKVRNLATATVDYWPLPTRDDVFLRLRYENGYEWTAPTVRRKQVVVSVAARF